MFGISFSELSLVALVALLVLGPERLPGAARTAGLWIGRFKRSVSAIKAEVERELGTDGAHPSSSTAPLAKAPSAQASAVPEQTGSPRAP